MFRRGFLILWCFMILFFQILWIDFYEKKFIQLRKLAAIFFFYINFIFYFFYWGFYLLQPFRPVGKWQLICEISWDERSFINNSHSRLYGTGVWGPKKFILTYDRFFSVTFLKLILFLWNLQNYLRPYIKSINWAFIQKRKIWYNFLALSNI